MASATATAAAYAAPAATLAGSRQQRASATKQRCIIAPSRKLNNSSSRKAVVVKAGLSVADHVVAVSALVEAAGELLAGEIGNKVSASAAS
eukprot:CAMPEP_0197577486 /NCGR_PEP_ID=MMETSP1326-20131121/2099_1 /TAXON_ID=1155430 /ORGANISM="Genus nov. species nov., Strain RCC2288" /LENGTH=90 /DNA_ID=CAMNT_0043140565 /DNA_START=58 /DNA_END=326 /DNA_ORIENTATION=+